MVVVTIYFHLLVFFLSSPMLSNFCIFSFLSVYFRLLLLLLLISFNLLSSSSSQLLLGFLLLFEFWTSQWASVFSIMADGDNSDCGSGDTDLKDHSAEDVVIVLAIDARSRALHQVVVKATSLSEILFNPWRDSTNKRLAIMRYWGMEQEPIRSQPSRKWSLQENDDAWPHIFSWKCKGGIKMESIVPHSWELLGREVHNIDGRCCIHAFACDNLSGKISLVIWYTVLSTDPGDLSSGTDWPFTVREGISSTVVEETWIWHDGAGIRWNGDCLLYPHPMSLLWQIMLRIHHLGDLGFPSMNLFVYWGNGEDSKHGDHQRCNPI